MIFPVRVFDAAGNLKQEIPVEVVKKRFWQNFKSGEISNRDNPKDKYGNHKKSRMFVGKQENLEEFDTSLRDFKRALRN